MSDVSDAGDRERSSIRRKIDFLRPYSIGLASAARLFAVGWMTRSGRARIVDMCREIGYHHDRRVEPELPTVKAEAVAPDSERIMIVNLDAVDGNVSERELLILARIVAHRKPSTIFEIGTFDGRTTSNLAANAPEDARVYTLDLPADVLDKLNSPLDSRETAYARKPESGTRFRGTQFETSITQLYGDSATFDFSPYSRSMDFVFVDGSHAFSYVMADSLNAARMLRDSGGLVVWHDYARWDGVTAALNKLRQGNREFESLRWIEGTTLAVLER